MAPLDLGDLGSLAAVVVAVIALWFAGRSAKASVRSASAAETSATTAEETLALTRAAHHRQEKPQFEIGIDRPSGEICPVWVRMLDGPTRVLVDADWFSESERPPQGEPAGAQVSEIALKSGTGHGQYELVKNEEMCVQVKVPDDAVRVEVKIVLRAVEADENDDVIREWHHAEVVIWAAPPVHQVFWA